MCLFLKLNYFLFSTNILKLHEKFYYSGKNGYRVETYNYKSAQDFYDDMKARGLAFIEEEHNSLYLGHSIVPLRLEGILAVPSALQIT